VSLVLIELNSLFSQVIITKGGRLLTMTLVEVHGPLVLSEMDWPTFHSIGRISDRIEGVARSAIQLDSYVRLQSSSSDLKDISSPVAKQQG
jgi:hypothetical protein